MRFYHNFDEIIINHRSLTNYIHISLSYSTYLNNVLIYNKLMVLVKKYIYSNKL